MSIQLIKPTLGRIALAVVASLFILRLPELMPMVWRVAVVSLILAFFLFLPDQKGTKGGLVAAFFSLVFAGLGQLYVREYVRALLFITAAVFGYMTTGYSGKAWVFNNVLFIIAAIDAFSYAKRGIGIL